MAKYYGTLESDKGTTTRAGHRYIKATAQTFDGSVTVSIEDDLVEIWVRSGSGVGGFLIGGWPLSEFVAARKLAIEKEG